MDVHGRFGEFLTQKVRVVLDSASSNSYTSLVLSKLTSLVHPITRYTHAKHESILSYTEFSDRVKLIPDKWS